MSNKLVKTTQKSSIELLIAGWKKTSKLEKLTVSSKILGASVSACLAPVLIFNSAQTLFTELEDLIKKGKINEASLNSSDSQHDLFEILKLLETDVPEDTRFNAIKALFLSTLTVDEKSVLKQRHLLNIVKELPMEDIVILQACYQIELGGSLKTNSTLEWRKAIAKQIGHNLTELVFSRETKLISEKLLNDYKYEDKSGFKNDKYGWLTPLGHELCKSIAQYGLS